MGNIRLSSKNLRTKNTCLEEGKVATRQLSRVWLVCVLFFFLGVETCLVENSDLHDPMTNSSCPGSQLILELARAWLSEIEEGKRKEIQYFKKVKRTLSVSSPSYRTSI